MVLNQALSSLPSLAEGGEGIIYEYNSQIIKKYKSNVNMTSKETKCKSLIAKQLPIEVVKPLDVVYDKKNIFIGFLMDKVNGEEFKKLSNKKFVTANGITTKDILKMLVRLKEVMDILHNQNIFFGDLNDQNILFDSQYNIYLIDCDSWSIDKEKCEVAMDLFKDPLLKSNNFNKDTDTYAFSILAWKILTRIHPFGGTMNPDMSIMDRMNQGVSVINNPDVTIPRTIKSWNNLSPDLITAFQNIYQNKSRQLDNQLSDLLNDLKYCDVDKEYYYGKFTTCPLCDKNAKLVIKPISQGLASGLTLIEVLNKTIIKAVINEFTYLDVNDYIVDIASGKKVKYIYGNRYYFTRSGVLIEEFGEKFIIHNNEDYEFDKKYRTVLCVEGDVIYYVSKHNTFTKVEVLAQGNNIKNITKCSNNVYFGVSNDNYCLVNYYSGKLIININGMNSELAYNYDIINYGIHYDKAKNRWLIIFENSTGGFFTFIMNQNVVEYSTELIKYSCQLSNVCIANHTIFIPIDGKIRGFAYEKSIFKDFECSVVNPTSKLIKNNKKFTVVNDENIYYLG